MKSEGQGETERNINMAKWNVYTPEGVQDILEAECYWKKELESKARNLFRQKGYKEIETPSIEFYDVYSARQKMLSQETMFKFYDKEGRILALRPELTVPAVRVATSKLKEQQKPLILCYIGNSFRYNESGGGKQKEYTQAGIEIIGAEGAQADAEVIATAIELLLEAGLENFQIDIGQVEFFKGLMAEGGFSKEEAEALRSCIDNKDYAGMERILNEKELQVELKQTISALPGLFGYQQTIKELKKSNLNPQSRKALENLEEILAILEDYGYSQYVSVDLGMLPGLDYYTGMIFRGFTYDIGFPVCSGGRYDNLAETFGEQAAATGFSLGINMLITAMRRQKLLATIPATDYFVAYAPSARKAAFAKAKELRTAGKQVSLDVKGFSMEEAMEYATEKGYSNLIYITEGSKVNTFDFSDMGGATL